MMQTVSSRFPYLAIELTVGYRTERFEALIDTGFSEDLIVPASFSIVGPASGRMTVRLADGRPLHLPSFDGVSRIGGFLPFAVTVIALGSNYLVGRKVIERFGVLHDHGRRVVVDL